jgi:hypothetical protein
MILQCVGELPAHISTLHVKQPLQGYAKAKNRIDGSPCALIQSGQTRKQQKQVGAPVCQTDPGKNPSFFPGTLIRAKRNGTAAIPLCFVLSL